MPQTTLKVSVAALFTLLCIAAAEASLRLFHPKYQYAAESKYTRDRVLEKGGEFFVVFLPYPSRRTLPSELIEDGFRVIDLYPLATEVVEDYDRREFRFRNDGHWNEAGNQLAAVLLHDSLSRGVLRGTAPVTKPDRALFAYYNAFPDGWMPRRWIARGESDAEFSEQIRRKYTALDAAVGAR